MLYYKNLLTMPAQGKTEKDILYFLVVRKETNENRINLVTTQQKLDGKKLGDRCDWNYFTALFPFSSFRSIFTFVKKHSFQNLSVYDNHLFVHSMLHRCCSHHASYTTNFATAGLLLSLVVVAAYY